MGLRRRSQSNCSQHPIRSLPSLVHPSRQRYELSDPSDAGSLLPVPQRSKPPQQLGAVPRRFFSARHTSSRSERHLRYWYVGALSFLQKRGAFRPDSTSLRLISQVNSPVEMLRFGETSTLMRFVARVSLSNLLPCRRLTKIHRILCQVIKATNGNYTFPAPLGHLPLTLRGGNTFLLHSEPGYTIYDTQQSAYALLVSLSASGEAYGTAYLDDGESWPVNESRTVNFGATTSKVYGWTTGESSLPSFLLPSLLPCLTRP